MKRAERSTEMVVPAVPDSSTCLTVVVLPEEGGSGEEGREGCKSKSDLDKP